MIRFYPEVFTLGLCDERVFDTPVAKFAVLDNFWSDFEAVQKQLEEMPYAPTTYSCDDVADYRSSWVSTINGNELPCMDQLNEKVQRIFQEQNFDHNMRSFCKAELCVNLNLVQSDRIKDDFFNPHVDASRYSVVVFMNNEYHPNDGFNIYRPTDEYPGSWIPRDKLQVDTFIRGKANRAIIFKANQVLHGMEVRSDDFRDDYRCTTAIFLGL